MRRLTKTATSIPVIVALMAGSTLAASAQVEAGKGTVAQPTGAQVQWEKHTPGAYSWDNNRTLWNELHQSIRQFFGNTAGDYVERPSPKILQSREFAGYSLPSQQEWSLIATQFFDPFAIGTWRRGTILNGRWELYAFKSGGTVNMAFVTPVHSTKVIAAAMVHGTCPDTPVTPSMDRKTATQTRLRDMACSKPMITIFFKRPFDIIPAITQVLARQASKEVIEGCQAEPLQQPESDLHKRWVAKFGAPPPCGVHYKVVTLNELPTVDPTPPSERK